MLGVPAHTTLLREYGERKCAINAKAHCHAGQMNSSRVWRVTLTLNDKLTVNAVDVAVEAHKRLCP